MSATRAEALAIDYGMNRSVRCNIPRPDAPDIQLFSYQRTTTATEMIGEAGAVIRWDLVVGGKTIRPIRLDDDGWTVG